MDAHSFPKTMDNMGGQAFRDWYMLCYRDGVFVGFHKHKKIEMYSLDPKTIWTPGCQDSCCYGDAAPSGGKWEPIEQADDRIKPKLRAIADELWSLLEAEAVKHSQQKKQAECNAIKKALATREAIVAQWLDR